MRSVVAWLMDKACEWSGHRLACYNRPVWANRLWAWALDLSPAEQWAAPGVRQCAGMAIFRNNVGKLSRNPTAADHVFEPDEETVFATDEEFLDYHREAMRETH